MFAPRMFPERMFPPRFYPPESGSDPDPGDGTTVDALTGAFSGTVSIIGSGISEHVKIKLEGILDVSG